MHTISWGDFLHFIATCICGTLASIVFSGNLKNEDQQPEIDEVIEIRIGNFQLITFKNPQCSETLFPFSLG